MVRSFYIMWSFLLCFSLSLKSTAAQAAVCYGISNVQNVLTISVTANTTYSTAPNNHWVTGNFTLSWPSSLGTTVVQSWAAQNGFGYAPDGPVRTDGSVCYQKFGFTASTPVVLNLVNGTSMPVLTITVGGGNSGSTGSFSIVPAPPSSLNNGGAAFSSVFSDEYAAGSCATTVTGIPMNFCNPEVVTDFEAIIENSTTAHIVWKSRVGSERYRVQYRAAGATAWTNRTVTGYPTNSAKITGLLPNTTYQYRIREFCWNGTNGPFTAINTFVTYAADPTCDGPNGWAVTYTPNTPTQATVLANYEPGAWRHQIRYRAVGTSTWLLVTKSTAAFVLSGLTPATWYEFQLRVACVPQQYGTFQPIDSFLTLPALPPNPNPIPVTAYHEESTTLDVEKEPLAFSLYPNPALEELRLDFSETLQKPMAFKIIGSLGQVLHEQTFTEFVPTVEVVDLTGFSSGTYFIEVFFDGGKKEIRRFVRL